MKWFKNALTIAGFLAVILLLIILTPVPEAKENNCQEARGTVKHIFEAGTKDVVFKLNETDKTFYINRGLEQGLDLERLRRELVNQEVLIKYPKYWTPLDPFNKTRSIAQLQNANKVIFSKIK